jgi:hypothetical protein
MTDLVDGTFPFHHCLSTTGYSSRSIVKASWPPFCDGWDQSARLAPRRRRRRSLALPPQSRRLPNLGQTSLANFASPRQPNLDLDLDPSGRLAHRRRLGTDSTSCGPAAHSTPARGAKIPGNMNFFIFSLGLLLRRL